MAMAEDFDAFFDLDEFGVTATIGGVDVVGIFSREWQTIVINDIPVSGFSPVFDVPTGEITATYGTAVAVLGDSYIVVDHQDDGTGISRLILQKQ